MKKIILLSVICFCINKAMAQTNYLSPKLAWSYLWCYGSASVSEEGKINEFCSTILYYLSGDTIINGKGYHKMYCNDIYNLAIRMDSINKVYYCNVLGPTEYILYNYNAEIGDTFSSNYINTVVQKDSIFISNNFKKRFILSNNDTVIQDIGNINKIMGFWITPDCDPCYDKFTLLCLTDSNVIKYKNKIYNTCDTTFHLTKELGIKENSVINNLRITNPIYDKLSISYVIEKTSNIQIYLFDNTGTIKRNIEIRNQNQGDYIQDIQMNDLPSGLYLLQFKINDNTFVKKIIKM